jgi:hypothetical protein
VHPNVPFSKVKFLFFSALAQYGKGILEFITELDVDLDVPIALWGDVKNHQYEEFLEKHYGLRHHPMESPMTLGCTGHRSRVSPIYEYGMHALRFVVKLPPAYTHKITEMTPMKGICNDK